MNNAGLHSFTIWRESDHVSCHVWMDGGERCSEINRAMPVPRSRVGSHLSVQDYLNVALEHLKAEHPEVRL